MLFQRNPAEWQKVLDDPGRIPARSRRSLRYWPPSQYQGRVLTDDVTLHGVDDAEGVARSCCSPDRRTTTSASTTTPSGSHRPPDHLAVGFGHGLHFCVGAALARLEGRVGLEEFAQRFPDYEIDESKLERVHMSNVHGFSHVPFTVS